MKNHNTTKSELLVNKAISTAMAVSLMITLTILWGEAEWTTEGLEEFVDRYWEFLDAYNRHEHDARELVSMMQEETGIKVIWKK